MSNLLTVSRLRAYRKCARLERFLYVESWRPVHEADALAFGTLWHRGMDVWWEQHRFGYADVALESALAAVAGHATDPFAQVRVEEMLRGYDERWRDQTYVVLGIEDEFRAALLHPETFERHPHWQLGGKIDKRILDGTRRLIVDHKTSSEDISPAADYWAKLQMDHQISNYTLGAETLDWAPDAFLYDVAKKPALRPLASNSRRSAPETPDDYRERVRAAIHDDLAGYFQRREVPRIESQLADFLADAWEQAASMSAAHRRGRAPRNPDACFAYGRCPFWLCCSTGSAPDDHPALFERIPNPHPELTDDRQRESERRV